jgi:hypothetical protein
VRRVAGLLFALALTGCASSTAGRLAELSQAVNRGHYRDETLPPEARIIARDNWDAWSVQLQILRGDPLPPEVEGRVTREQ